MNHCQKETSYRVFDDHVFSTEEAATEYVVKAVQDYLDEQVRAAFDGGRIQMTGSARSVLIEGLAGDIGKITRLSDTISGMVRRFFDERDGL